MDSDIFLERYPVFIGVPVDIIDTVITEQSLKISETIWTNPIIRDKAIGLLTAHVLRLEYGDLINLGASLRSIEEGKEVKISLVDLSLPYYQQTIYGQQWLQLRKSTLGLSMFVV